MSMSIIINMCMSTIMNIAIIAITAITTTTA